MVVEVLELVDVLVEVVEVVVVLVEVVVWGACVVVVVVEVVVEVLVVLVVVEVVVDDVGGDMLPLVVNADGGTIVSWPPLSDQASMKQVPPPFS